MATVKHRASLIAAAGGIVGATLLLSAGQTTPAQALGVYAEAQALRGAGLYAENCAQCHTRTLERSSLAPALTGPAFVARWTRDKPLSDVFDYMRSSMPLNSPGGLSLQQNADLLAFLLKKSGYQAGNSALPSTSAQLASVKVAK
jgi:mono/diheme cytochrome c family protein